MMKRSTPFAAAIAFAQALAAISSLPLSERHIAQASLGSYQGRGKGRGIYSGRKPGNVGTNWMARLKGKTNGPRECARRVRQMNAAGLRTAPASYDRNAA